MKRFAILSAVVVALVLLSSCYMMTSRPTATIHLSFAAARAITGQSVDKVRVSLYSYAAKTAAHTLWTFADTNLSYKEAPYPGDVEVSVPKGYLWKVLVSAGTDGPNGSFATAWYGSSEVFALVEDRSVAVTNTASSPFLESADLMGTDLNGVRVVGSTVYASSTGLLFKGATGVDPSVTGTMNAVAGSENLGKIQSLANGWVNGAAPTPVLFVNTDQGIVPYNPLDPNYASTDGFDNSFSTDLTDAASGARYTILQSGALDYSYNETTTIAVFYQRSGGLGGILLTPEAPTPAKSWVDFDLSSYHITDKPILDFALHTSADSSRIYGYFASVFGTFRTDSSALTSQGAIEEKELRDYAAFLPLPNGEPIQTLAISGDMIYGGTASGAYYATLNEPSTTEPVKQGQWSRIGETTGDNIVKITATSGGLIAMRSKDNLYVYGPTEQWKTYPFFAGLPGELHSMTWDEESGTLYLVGSSGLVALPVGQGS